MIADRELQRGKFGALSNLWALVLTTLVNSTLVSMTGRYWQFWCSRNSRGVVTLLPDQAAKKNTQYYTYVSPHDKSAASTTPQYNCGDRREHNLLWKSGTAAYPVASLTFLIVLRSGLVRLVIFTRTRQLVSYVVTCIS